MVDIKLLTCEAINVFGVLMSQLIETWVIFLQTPTHAEEAVGLTLDAVVVEVQVLQVTVDEWNRSDLVVGQLQVQQGGDVEHSLGKSFVTELVVVQPHKRQVGEAFEVISEWKNRRQEELWDLK